LPIKLLEFQRSVKSTSEIFFMTSAPSRFSWSANLTSASLKGTNPVGIKCDQMGYLELNIDNFGLLEIVSAYQHQMSPCIQ